MSTITLNENLNLIKNVYKSLNREYGDLFEPNVYEKYESVYKNNSTGLNGIVFLHPSNKYSVHDVEISRKVAERGIMYIMLSMFETRDFRSKRGNLFRQLDASFALGFFNSYLNLLQQRTPSLNKTDKFLVFQNFWNKKQFTWEKSLETCSSVNNMERKIESI